ncbi:17331_t:CDS:10, partial [Cetraspora pellucida]
MSRHRNIRKLKVEEIFEEEYGYDENEDYGTGNFEMTLKQKTQMEEGKIKVKSVIGQVEGITDKDIEDALWHYYFDTEQTINWLLDQVHKSQARKQKRSQKQVTSNNSQENKDLNINTNSSLLEDEHLCTTTSRTKTPILECSQSVTDSPPKNNRTISCITLWDIWSGHNVNWRHILNNPRSSVETPIFALKQSRFTRGGLLGGADSETPNSQQRLSSTRSTYASLSDLSSAIPSNSGLQRQGLSLSSLAQESLSHSTGRISLTKLVPNKSKTINSSQATNLNIGISQKLTSNLNLSKTKPLTTLLNTSDSTPSLKLLSSYSGFNSSASPNLNNVEHSSLKYSAGFQSSNFQKQTMLPSSLADNTSTLRVQSPSNPLIAPPSIFAIAIFAKLQDVQLPSNDLFTFELYSTGSRNQKGFAFDQPSPDDIVLNAQSKKTSGGSKGKQITAQPSPLPPLVNTTNNGTKKYLDESIKENDDVIEILDDNDEQLKFDINALSLAESSKTSFSKIAEPINGLVNQGTVSPHISLYEQKTPTKANIKSSKRINVLEEYKKRVADKLPLNLVVIGHVDAGKSTLMGHLLYLLGEVNERTMKQYERDSSKIGKSSFAYAWVLDETGEERNRGITMDIAIRSFETKNRRFTLLDAPGHRDFIPNMISGASQADVAILVVDATVGEFESGFEANGQTKEHALLIRSLGVQQLIVAINKLDTVEWSKARYDEIVEKLCAFLNQVGFKKDKVAHIPCSGLIGENIMRKSSGILDWYNGETLIEQIDKFEPPTRLLEKPFRLSVTDFFKGGLGNVGGVSVAGRIESGTIQVGEEITVIPGGERGVVKVLTVNEESSKWAAAGDSVLLTLIDLDILQLKIGSVLCPPSQPVPITSHFLARIVVFDVKIPITRGFPVILHRQSLNEPANVIKLVNIIDKNTGDVIKKNPRHLPKSSTATVEIKLSNRPIPLEAFKDNKELGRIMLRKGGETVAAGIVID